LSQERHNNGSNLGSDSPLYQYIADTVERLLPKALEYEIPGTAELDITSIPDRIRADLNVLGYAALVAPVVCAWCKKPAAGES
jgi:hypothetical protein